MTIIYIYIYLFIINNYLQHAVHTHLDVVSLCTLCLQQNINLQKFSHTVSFFTNI